MALAMVMRLCFMQIQLFPVALQMAGTVVMEPISLAHLDRTSLHRMPNSSRLTMDIDLPPHTICRYVCQVLDAFGLSTTACKCIRQALNFALKLKSNNGKLLLTSINAALCLIKFK